MNDENPDREAGPEVGQDAGLDAAQDARIRALLAELGSGPDGEPIPAEVEVRLDDTLARLVAERDRTGSEEATSGDVVPLRRRWLPRAAVAAAAVIVLGVGGLAVANLGLFGLSPTGENTAADSAGESESKSTGEGPDPSADSGTDSGTAGAAALPELGAATFASDVAVLLEGRQKVLTPEREAADEGAQNRDSAKPDAPGALTSRACPGPEITDGAVANQVRYDGQLAVLLIHPERGGRQVVQAWNCAGDQRLASTTVRR